MNLIHPKYQLNQNFFASISVRGDSPIDSQVYLAKRHQKVGAINRGEADEEVHC